MKSALCTSFHRRPNAPGAQLPATFCPTQDAVQVIRAPLAERGGGSALDCIRFTTAEGPRTSNPLQHGPL